MISVEGDVFLIENLINNNFVISLLTGFLSAFIIEFLKSIKKRKEYFNRIELVEDEFLIFLKSLIVQDDQPESNSIHRYLRGVASKYNVKFEDVSNIEGVVNKLTKDILDSQFLNFNKKLEFCSKVEKLFSQYSSNIESTTKESESELYFKLNFFRYRRLQSQLITFLFCSLTILMLLLYKEGKILFDSGIKFQFDEREGSIFFYMIFMSSLTLFYYIYDKKKTSKRLRNKLNQGDVKNS